MGRELNLYGPFSRIEQKPSCPLCDSTGLVDDGFRTALRCSSCGSDGRERMMGAVLRRTDLGLPAGPVIHFAPRPGIAKAMHRRFGNAYVPAEISRMTEPFEPGSVYGFIHSHVLQQVPADPGEVIELLNAALMPGGFHMFQIPLREGGREIASAVFPRFRDFIPAIMHTRLGVEDAERHAIPVSALSGDNASRVYCFVKPIRVKRRWRWPAETPVRISRRSYER